METGVGNVESGIHYLGLPAQASYTPRESLCPTTYRQHGLEQVRFPPDSGDLNPIETVWAWLRRDLPVWEQVDLSEGRVLTPARFRQRVAQLLNSYGIVEEGQSYSRLQKLVRGMPRRLAACRKNKFGRCGK